MPDTPQPHKEILDHEVTADCPSEGQSGREETGSVKVASTLRVSDSNHAGDGSESCDHPNPMNDYAAAVVPSPPSATRYGATTVSDAALPDERLRRIDRALLALSLGYAIRFSGCTNKLSNAADRAGLERIPLKDFLADSSVLVRELTQLKGIGRKTIDEAVERVEAFVEAAVHVSAAAASSSKIVLAGGAEAAPTIERPEAPATSSVLVGPRSPRERLADAVLRLPTKEKFVFDGRFGLNGQAERTLQELAEVAQVTRERIRQIEAKALRQLRLPMHRVLLNEFLRTEKDEIWNAIACGNDLATQQEVRDARGRLDPWQKLAIELVHENLGGWLAQHATRIGTGWLKQGIDPEVLGQATKDLDRLAESQALPMPMATASVVTGLDLGEIGVAVENSSVLTHFEGYLVAGRAGAKARRTVRMHAVAVRMRPNALFDVATLAGLYRGEYPEDECGPRVLQMQMDDATNLFCHLFDNLWFALPATGDAASLSQMFDSAGAHIRCSDYWLRSSPHPSAWPETTTGFEGRSGRSLRRPHCRDQCRCSACIQSVLPASCTRHLRSLPAGQRL
jgi:GNAT superfamily N-acetyltransferase